MQQNGVIEVEGPATRNAKDTGEGAPARTSIFLIASSKISNVRPHKKDLSPITVLNSEEGHEFRRCGCISCTDWIRI